MDGAVKRIELAARRTLVRLFRVTRRRTAARVSIPIPLEGRRVLVLRHDRIGDMLVTVPLLHALKRRYPTVRIDLLVSERNSFVAPGDPSIDSRFIYRKNLFALMAMIGALRRNRYDVVIDAMDNASVTSSMLVAMCGARCSVGFDKENAAVYDVVVPRASQATVHVVDRLGALLRPFGIDPDGEDLSLRYVPAAGAASRASAWMREHAHGLPRIGIVMFASGVHKSWSADACVETIRRLRTTHPDASFVLFAPDEHREEAAAVCATANASLFTLPSFEEFAAGIAACSTLITVDTSAVHLAAAFRIPSVVLYVRDNPCLMPWFPYRSPFQAVTTDSGVAGITAEEVVAAFDALDAACHITAVPA